MMRSAGPPGRIARVLVRDYAGDSTNNRVLDLGDEYDFVLIFSTSNFGGADSHGPIAHALHDGFGCFLNIANHTIHVAGTGTLTRFQGKLTGADSTKVMLGTDGPNESGYNRTGQDFTILGFKFASPES